MEDKHYYLESDIEFPTVLQWLQTQVRDGRLVLKGRSEARCEGILKDSVDAAPQWDRAFDFFRTAASVMKLAMIKATGLQEFYSPPFYYKKSNDSRIVSSPDKVNKREINYGGHLANDESEAKKLWKKFGELYDYKIVNGALTSKSKGKFLPLCNFEKEMIVVYETTGSVWHIKSCLRVETNCDVITRGALFVTVLRYDLAAGQSSLVDFNPFQPPDQPGVVLAKKKPDLSFDELVESVKKLDISPKGRSKE